MKKPEVYDDRFRSVIGENDIEKLCTGALWSEGPVWIPNQNILLWSDIPNNRILSWCPKNGMQLWRTNVEFTNGHTLDNSGNLLHCSHGLRAIVKTPTKFGEILPETPEVVVVDNYQGKRLNSPNDVVVKSDGTIWFTDPPYGILSDKEGHKASSEQAANHVFCFDPRTGELNAASSWLEEPNGLAFSPDEKTLYVSDTSAALKPSGQGNHHIVAFTVNGSSLESPRIFINISPGLPDGFRVAENGWIYTSCEEGVQVYDPQGCKLGLIPIPEKVGNLTFGGQSNNELYIAASTSIYRIKLLTKGNR